MKILQNISILVSLIFFCSCSNVVYYEVVPNGGKTLSSFPKELMGQYVDHDEDTLFIYSNSYKYGAIDHESLFEGELGSDVILKKSKGYYFLNFKNSDGYWELIAGQLKGKELSLLTIDTENDEHLKIINSYLNGKDAKSLNKDDKILINPTDKELFNLLKDERICDKSLLTKLK